MLLVVALGILAGAAAAQDDLDFGDAPDAGVDPRWSYPTLLADDGARHVVPASPTHTLGDSPTPFIERVSVDSAGVQGDFGSGSPSISADGRFVAFSSGATNLVPGDTNGELDVFVHDRITGDTSRVSVDSAGSQGNEFSSSPSISNDGRFVAFRSGASNLVPGDTNDDWDIFVHDRITGDTSLVSVDSAGNQGIWWSQRPSISGGGRFVIFESPSPNLVPGDTNDDWDIFVHDRTTATTSRVSTDSAGIEGNGNSMESSISADGRYVAFTSWATNLVPGDTNGDYDIFVHDRSTGTTTRVSTDSTGIQGNDWSDDSSISADGRFVAFESLATNLVPGDTNEKSDVFVHDRTTGTTTRVSVDSSGGQGDYGSRDPSISADGRFVAFSSGASNLVSGDINGLGDVFVHDRTTGATSAVSINSGGYTGDGHSWVGSISADGRFVAFSSEARNLIRGDTNSELDAFVSGEYDPLDAEPDGSPTTSADGDDRDGNDDEGGVQFPCCMYPGQLAPVLIDASAAGFVNAWIDFNGDGDWGDAGEQILTDRAVAAGGNQIEYSVPFLYRIPTTYARVRFTSYDTVGSLGVTGLANDGEVEDYRISGTPIFIDGFESGDTARWSVSFP